MVCLCTTWTRPLFWIRLDVSEEVSSKLIQIWAHRTLSFCENPIANEMSAKRRANRTHGMDSLISHAMIEFWDLRVQ